MSGKLKKQDLKKLLKQVDELTHDFDRRLADAVLEVSIRANLEAVRELKGDASMCQALLEIMEPEITKIKEQIMKETADRVAKETADRVARETAHKEARENAANMLKFGNFSPEKIQKYIPRLSIEEIKSLATS